MSFRPLAPNDLARLTSWLNAPHVARFWRGPSDLGSVREHYQPRIDAEDPVRCLIVSWDGLDCAMFQHSMCDADPDWAARVRARPGEAGIDYLIGEASLTGRGLGPIMLAAFLEREVLADPAVTGVRVDIDAENRRSRRALEKLGFVHQADLDFLDDGVRFVVYDRPR